MADLVYLDLANMVDLVVSGVIGSGERIEKEKKIGKNFLKSYVFRLCNRGSRSDYVDFIF